MEAVVVPEMPSILYRLSQPTDTIGLRGAANAWSLVSKGYRKARLY
jgi:hypothetical protein